ncbi:probable LRR receptor-like serine/threonine-protein kinase At3g47570 [Salvia splendens]|uniref:probable LRR receptor-like serine/threonine-protein kinase At3g47570 n=1 Tax=Salvia splendens TaxID=180675 RepID=UPI001C2609DC|nr:probable LRR receptor-like serine/threonine-protein kinase At3g47570 [Salvia splendens]
MANSMTFLLSLPLFFFFLLTTLLPPTTCSTNQTDQLSLLAIKSSLQDPQGALSSWNQTLPLCSWRGIQCRGNRVVALTLPSLGLVGNLSPHIGNLSLLTNITLRDNSFQGPIPPQITLLPMLQLLDFRNNSFIGQIPKNIYNCTNLVRLDFTLNFLSGAIPNELGFLPKLETIAFSRNRFSGLIPSSIGNITTLQRLSLGSCNFSGEIPESLGRLHSLEFLQLSENNFTGSIPHGLFNISSIIYFDVSVNSLEGVIPFGVTLPSIAVLLLEGNLFSGPIPSFISNASLIEWIVLSTNQFTGPIPNLERLSLIQDFFLHSNLIEDDMSFISSLTNSTKLERFDVSENMLSGSLPESLANLSVLVNIFDIHENQIHGSIPLGIGNLVNLDVVDLSHNLLDGQIPVSMSKLSNLHNLFMGRNRFRGELPSLFGNMTLLSRFQLNGNELSGNVPSSLGSFSNLLELDLSENKFTGLIPREIMRLSSLSIVLNLSHNALEGSIPSEVGSLRNLAALDLSSNRLSGVIPTSLSSCVSLQQLYLDENLLQGEIPAGMSSLMGLQQLDLSQNNLSGSIPSFLENLKLEKLNLSFNRLQGEVPSKGVFTNLSSISLDGNQGFCGGIEELKFPTCKGVQSSKGKLSTLWKILIPIVVIGGLCIVILVFFKCKKTKEHPRTFVSSEDTIGGQLLRLSYADLLKATNGFSESNVVGFGRFGSVYKAVLDDEKDIVVAVKVLNLEIRGASKTFMAECRALGGIRHRNLVKLVSVCDSVDFKGKDFKALVYEFKVNGSLDKWLHNNEEGSSEDLMSLSIIQRLNIALDIAHGIKYLHFGSGSSIIHGDLKPSNILLDHDMVACVGDFGLAKISSNIFSSSYESNTSSFGIKGTLGYVPPEYGTFGSISMQGDVYSFGIIIVEMFINKRPTNDLFGGEVNLHKYVSSALPHGLMDIIDPQLEIGDLKMEFIGRILSIGVSCSKENPRDRMPINLVENELADILAQLQPFSLDV